MIQTLDYTVVGEEKINCSACEARINLALKRLAGVKDVQASAKTQHVSVLIDPDQVAAEEVESTLEKMGYDVQSA